MLVLTGRRAAPLEECAQAARGAGAAEVLAWPADLTREAEVSALLGAIEARYGRLDLLFNNAGTNVPPTPFGEMGLKEWRHVVDINLTAAFHVAQQADISPTSPPYLPYTCPISALYLPYISPSHRPSPRAR